MHIYANIYFLKIKEEFIRIIFNFYLYINNLNFIKRIKNNKYNTKILYIINL